MKFAKIKCETKKTFTSCEQLSLQEKQNFAAEIK